jgi:hypothetical protein
MSENKNKKRKDFLDAFADRVVFEDGNERIIVDLSVSQLKDILYTRNNKKTGASESWARFELRRKADSENFYALKLKPKKNYK